MEIGRNQLFAVALASAVGGPYLASISTPGQPPTGSPTAPSRPGATAGAVPGGETATLALEGPRAGHPGEVFRFDVTPGWIMGRWGRVFTCTPESHLRGYRVALVTGTAEHDLAGSLTYYFNPQQQVQRIAFQGTTGDTRPLVALVTQRYGLARTIVADPGLHLYRGKGNDQSASELRIRATPVVQAAQPRARFTVELRLERPDEFRRFTQGPGLPRDLLRP